MLRYIAVTVLATSLYSCDSSTVPATTLNNNVTEVDAVNNEGSSTISYPTALSLYQEYQEAMEKYHAEVTPFLSLVNQGIFSGHYTSVHPVELYGSCELLDFNENGFINSYPRCYAEYSFESSEHISKIYLAKYNSSSKKSGFVKEAKVTNTTPDQFFIYEQSLSIEYETFDSGGRIIIDLNYPDGSDYRCGIIDYRSLMYGDDEVECLLAIDEARLFLQSL